MKDPLDKKVKKEIDKWRESGVKYSKWVERNIDRLNEIYCEKETTILSCTTKISLPITKMVMKDHNLLIEGEGYISWIRPFECSFDKRYAMTIKAFHTLREPDKLRIGFTAYDK